MESENKPQTAADELLELRKAQTKIYTRYPKLGWWYPPLFGLLLAVLLAAQAAPSWVGIVATVVVGAAIGACTSWYVKKRGVFPTYKDAPPLIKREMTIFYFSYGVGIIVVLAVNVFISWKVATLITFILATALTVIHERRYAKAAQKTEQNVGIQL